MPLSLFKRQSFQQSASPSSPQSSKVSGSSPRILTSPTSSTSSSLASPNPSSPNIDLPLTHSSGSFGFSSIGNLEFNGKPLGATADASPATGASSASSQSGQSVEYFDHQRPSSETNPFRGFDSSSEISRKPAVSVDSAAPIQTSFGAKTHISINEGCSDNCPKPAAAAGPLRTHTDPVSGSKRDVASNSSRPQSIRSLASSTSRTSLNSSQTVQSRKPSLNIKLKRRKTPNSRTSPISQPVPELPLLEIPENYRDLTNLFDSFQAPSEAHQNPAEDPSSMQQQHPDSGSSSFVTSSPARSLPEQPSALPAAHTNALNQHQTPAYEFYNFEAPYDDHREVESIQQPSPVATPNLANISANQFTSEHRLSSLRASAFNTHSSSSPVSLQNKTSFSSTSSPSSVSRSKFSQHESKATLSSKVRNIFTAKTNRSSVTLPDKFEADDVTAPLDSALVGAIVVEEDKPLAFSSFKVTPHFHTIDQGPTYRAQVIPVRNSSNRSASSNASPASQSVSRFSGTSETSSPRLLHNNDSETLDFVPNLRPSIDNVGSRFRSAGVPSPANLVMTKHQYEKYLAANKETNEKVSQDEDGEDDEEHDDDDESDDDDYIRSRTLEGEEAKKQDFRMRMKQDAHLSIYRQKMTKVTGSQLMLSGMNSQSRSKSFPTLAGGFALGAEDSDDDDDDVPLGILKAHGFPTSGQSKPARSQPNLLRTNSEDGQKQLNRRPSGDAISIRSPQRGPSPPSAPPVHDGYLAMRNQSSTNLPGFNASVPMNRGLVGEIAKEEEAKFRRKSVLLSAVAQKTMTMNGLPDSEIADNGHYTTNPTQSDELQTQLQQMMHMQSQILHQMASTPSPVLPPNPSQTPDPLRKTWSSFDFLGQRPPSRGGAPSIRSIPPGDYNNRSYTPGPAQQHRHSRPGHQSHNSFGSANEFERDNGFKLGPQPPVNQTMRMIHDDDSDDDDDEAGWEELEKRRQELRQMWKSQPSAVVS